MENENSERFDFGCSRAVDAVCRVTWNEKLRDIRQQSAFALDDNFSWLCYLSKFVRLSVSSEIDMRVARGAGCGGRLTKERTKLLLFISFKESLGICVLRFRLELCLLLFAPSLFLRRRFSLDPESKYRQWKHESLSIRPQSYMKFPSPDFYSILKRMFANKHLQRIPDTVGKSFTISSTSERCRVVSISTRNSFAAITQIDIKIKININNISSLSLPEAKKQKQTFRRTTSFFTVQSLPRICQCEALPKLDSL